MFNFSAELVKAHFDVLNDTSVLRQRSVLDVLRPNAPAKYYLSERIKRTILSNGTGGYVARSEIDMPIARPLCATMAKMHRACQDNYYSDGYIRGRRHCRYLGGAEGSTGVPIRRLMPEEAFALQGFPPENAQRAAAEGLCDGSLYKQAGNAVSVNVVYAILAYLANQLRWR